MIQEEKIHVQENQGQMDDIGRYKNTWTRELETDDKGKTLKCIVVSQLRAYNKKHTDKRIRDRYKKTQKYMDKIETDERFRKGIEITARGSNRQESLL